MSQYSADDMAAELIKSLADAIDGVYRVAPFGKSDDERLDAVASELSRFLAELRRRADADDSTNLQTYTEWFAKLEEVLPGLVFRYVQDATGSATFQYVGAKSREMFGLDPEEIKRDGSVLLATFHPDDEEFRDESTRESAATLKPWHQELRYVVEGSVRWYEGMALPTPRENGEVAWDGIVLDMTTRKRTEQALDMYRFTIDQAPDAVFWMNENAGFVYVNDQACRSLGYTREELLNLYLWDIDRIFPRERWSYEWELYRKGGEVGLQQVETRHWRKDGTSFPVGILAKHIWFEDVEFHVAFARDQTERNRVQADMEYFQVAIDHALDAIYWLNGEGGLEYVNQKACEMLGYTAEELLSLHLWDLDGSFSEERWAEDWAQFRKERSRNVVTEHRRKDGTLVPVEISATQVKFGDDERRIALARDISGRVAAEEERRRLETQLRQAQKMDMVGQLAGGVAHDFNNMLSVIMGYSEMILGEDSIDDTVRRYVQEIQTAAARSRDTTSQLLAFSRKQFTALKTLDLNKHIAATRDSLFMLIGEDIELRLEPDADLWDIRFDPTQIDQILVNLAVNARDAMPGGGVLTIRTANVVVDEQFCIDRIYARPGDYVLLMVSDDGVGMDDELQLRVFEPFFTTKDVGKGTGLGLSTVYGIIKQNGGFVEVESVPHQGATFSCYLKRYTGTVPEDPNEAERPAVSGSGTVLLVEDDKLVREMTESMVNSLGYSVLSAGAPQEALEMYRAKGHSVRLLITDVVMPGMGGVELAENLRESDPDLNVLFMSGYAPDVMKNRGTSAEGASFIQKPFTHRALAEAIRRLLAAN